MAGAPLAKVSPFSTTTSTPHACLCLTTHTALNNEFGVPVSLRKDKPPLAVLINHSETSIRYSRHTAIPFCPWARTVPHSESSTAYTPCYWKALGRSHRVQHVRRHVLVLRTDYGDGALAELRHSRQAQAARRWVVQEGPAHHPGTHSMRSHGYVLNTAFRPVSKYSRKMVVRPVMKLLAVLILAAIVKLFDAALFTIGQV